MPAKTKFSELIESTFSKYKNSVAGVSVSVIEDFRDDARISDCSFGYAKCSFEAKTKEFLNINHYLQCASLSKTVCAAFSIEYFHKKGYDMKTTSVNSVLKKINAKWRISSNHQSWDGDDVMLSMLLNHTALGMHYVWGFPITEGMPGPIELLDGSRDASHGYKKLVLEKRAGETFSYSGGGFVVMQYLIESFEGKSIEEITRPFMDGYGLTDFVWSQKVTTNPTTGAAISYAAGYKAPFTDEVSALAFPPFAAGGLCTTRALARFICQLARAYHNEAGSGSISHHTARMMMDQENCVDRGAMDFMGAKMGLGVFVASAGAQNKFILHQGANDGYRGVFLLCFDGPDMGKGCVILANGDNPAVLLQCGILRALLGESGLHISEGVHYENFHDSDLRFDTSNTKQESIVNKGLKDLVFSSFVNPLL